MNLTNTQSRHKKKIIFIFVVMLFIGLYTWINRSVRSLQTSSVIPVFNSENDNLALKRILSISRNSTIINAFSEINNEYIELLGNKSHNSGFVSGDGYVIKRTVINSYKNHGKKDNPYFYVVYKYHPFFTTYAKNIQASDLYLVELQNDVIIYSTGFEGQLLTKNNSPEWTNLIAEIKTHSKHDQVFCLPLQKSNEVLVGSPIYSSNQLIGILVVKMNQQDI